MENLYIHTCVNESKIIELSVASEEIALDSLLLSQCFQKLSVAVASKYVNLWKRDNFLY